MFIRDFLHKQIVRLFQIGFVLVLSLGVVVAKSSSKTNDLGCKLKCKVAKKKYLEPNSGKNLVKKIYSFIEYKITSTADKLQKNMDSRFEKIETRMKVFFEKQSKLSKASKTKKDSNNRDSSVDDVIQNEVAKQLSSFRSNRRMSRKKRNIRRILRDILDEDDDY